MSSPTPSGPSDLPVPTSSDATPRPALQPLLDAAVALSSAALEADSGAILRRLSNGSLALSASTGRSGALETRSRTAWLADLKLSEGLVQGSNVGCIAAVIPAAATPFGVLAVCRDNDRSFGDDERARLEALAQALGSTIAIEQSPLSPSADIRAGEDRFYSLFQNSQVGIATVRMSDGAVIDANDRSAEMYGYPDRESFLAAELPFQYSDPEGGQRVIRALRDDGETISEELMRRPDGSEVWVRSHLWRVPGTDLVEGVSIDVTPMREALGALEKSERKYRTMFDNARVGLGRLRVADGRLVEVNDYLARVAGYGSAAEFHAKAPLAGHHLVQPANTTLLTQLQETGRAEEPELEYRRVDGTTGWLHILLRTFDDGEYADAVVNDVTVEKRAARLAEELNHQLRARASERQQFVRQLLGAQEDERRRFAFEIHDGPAQKLSGAVMFLEAFNSERERLENANVEQNLTLGTKYLEEALSETRRIMSDLRPALLDDLGLVPALLSSFDELSARSDPRVEIAAELEEVALDPSVEIVLFRIAQEAVRNAIKHSGSDRVRVDLRVAEGQVELSVRDWGRGFDAEATDPQERRLGLISMRERVSLVGGTFKITSVKKRGTTLTALVPRRSRSDNRTVGTDG